MVLRLASLVFTLQSHLNTLMTRSINTRSRHRSWRDQGESNFLSYLVPDPWSGTGVFWTAASGNYILSAMVMWKSSNLQVQLPFPWKMYRLGILQWFSAIYERLKSQQGEEPTTPMDLHANLPEQLYGNADGKRIACSCGDRDCEECGQKVLTQHFNPQE